MYYVQRTNESVEDAIGVNVVTAMRPAMPILITNRSVEHNTNCYTSQKDLRELPHHAELLCSQLRDLVLIESLPCIHLDRADADEHLLHNADTLVHSADVCTDGPKDAI